MLAADGRLMSSVEYNCKKVPPSESDLEADQEWTKRGRSISVGRQAVETEFEDSTTHAVLAWDDDTNCYISLFWGQAPQDVVSVARAVVDAATPASVGQRP
jgi:hypothetical protein